MIYQRPTVGSLQQWANEVDDQKYSWDNFLPYYKKSVRFTAPPSTRDSDAKANYNPAAFATNGGPLRVSYPKVAQSFSSKCTEHEE